MQPGPVRAHYLKHNKACRIPRKFAYFDTEALRRKIPSGENQTWMLGVGCFDDERHRERGRVATTWFTFDCPEDFVRFCATITEPKYRTVLVAHNLAYDLRIANAFELLPKAGWTLEGARLDSQTAWVTWRRNDATLVMVDLFSWIPLPLWQVGQLVGIPQKPKPELDGDHLAWHERCRTDVEITREAYRRIIQFLRDEECGNWQPTGAGQAFACWRHRFMDVPVVVGDQLEWRSQERQAAWTGRCEVWKHGFHTGQTFTEWDFQSAYAQIGATYALPSARIGSVNHWNAQDILRRSDKVATLANVRVQTDTPCVPTTVNGRIAWPVGEFETWLWSPEIRLLVDSGATVDVISASAYRLAPVFRSFMEWAFAYAIRGLSETKTLEQEMVHQWQRSLVGRLGMRYKTWEPIGEAPTHDCAILPGRDADTGEAYRLLWIGKQMFRETELIEPDNGAPAIMSYVMSLMRAKLWDTMQMVGLQNVYYVDTDSIIVDGVGDKILARLQGKGKIPGFRRKHAFLWVDLKGPRQIIVHDSIRAAGVPKSAQRQWDGSFIGQTWRSAAASLKVREPNSVTILDRHIRLKGTDNRRHHLPNGQTEPIRLTLSA